MKSSMDPRKVRNILRTGFVVGKPCSSCVLILRHRCFICHNTHAHSHKKRKTGGMEQSEERAIFCLPCHSLSSWSSTSCLL